MNEVLEAYIERLLHFSYFMFSIESVDNVLNVEEVKLKEPLINNYLHVEKSEKSCRLVADNKVSPPIFIYKNKEKNLFWISNSFKFIYDKLVKSNLFVVNQNLNLVDFRKNPGISNSKFKLTDPNIIIENLKVVLDWSYIDIDLDDYRVTPNSLKFSSVDIYFAGFLIQNWLVKYKNLIRNYSINNSICLDLSGGINTRVNTFFVREFSSDVSSNTRSTKNEFDNMIGLLVSHALNLKRDSTRSDIYIGGKEAQSDLRKVKKSTAELTELYCRLKLLSGQFSNIISTWNDENLYTVDCHQTDLLRKSLAVLCCKDLLYIPFSTARNEDLYYLTLDEDIKRVIKSWYETGLEEPEDKNLPYWTYKREVM